MALFVKLSSPTADERGTKLGCRLPVGTQLREAWRVAVEGTRCVLEPGFERERDATAAMMALNANGLIDLPTLVAAGKAERERIMLEAMAW